MSRLQMLDGRSQMEQMNCDYQLRNLVLVKCRRMVKTERTMTPLAPTESRGGFNKSCAAGFSLKNTQVNVVHLSEAVWRR